MSAATQSGPTDPVVRHPFLRSWRSAIRLAWRDARKHKAGSLLILAMIGLPVLVVCAAAAVLATGDVTARESLPVTVGRGQALITAHQGTVEQTVDGQLIQLSDEPPPSPVPGRAPGDPWTPAQLAQLTGGKVGLSGTTSAVIRLDSSARRTAVRVVGPEVLADSGLATLLEGRWPEQPGEVLVTESGAADGLPRTGTIGLATNRLDSAAKIVGVARATGSDFEPVSLLAGPEWLDVEDTDSFLMLRDEPVTWADVRAWNAAGLAVLSPAVIADPPPGVRTKLGPGSENVAIVVLLSCGLVLETALLVGPAFAVSAARRRRSLALIASNGADHGQVVRYVAAQGIVLGGLAIVVGAALGTLVGWLGIRVAARLFDPSRLTTIGRPPLDTSAWVVAMVMLVALIAAVLSALLPGLRLAEQDIAAELAGRPQRQRTAKGLPITGAIMMVVGAVLVGSALAFYGTPASLVAAGVGGSLLVIGALFEIPLVIERVGRWARHAPASVRIGMREVARTRSRSAPAVAAITVAVAVLTMITISTLSDDAQSRRDYLPSTLVGAGVIGSHGPMAATVAEIRAQHPNWSVEPAGSVGDEESTEKTVRVSAVPRGCTPEQAIQPFDGVGRPSACQLHSSDNGWRISVPALNTLNPAAGLDSGQRRAFEHGTLLVTNPELIRDGKVALAVAAYGPGPVSAGVLRRTVDVPAALITMDQAYALDHMTYTPDPSYDSAGTAIISAAGVQQAGLPWTVESYEVVDPAGPISRADEQAINDRVAVPLSVERGFQSGSAPILLVLLAVAITLALVGSLISTALNQVEGRVQSATLSAIGATSGFRRSASGSQAVMIAAIGAALGVTLGIAPGLALAATLTTDWDPAHLEPVFVVPYARFALLVVGVPLLAAALAVITLRQDPVLTRRPT